MPADEPNDPVPPAASPAGADEFGEGFDDRGWDDQYADDGQERTVRAIVAAIVLVIVVILVLMLVRTCGTTAKSVSGGDKSIVAVPAKVRSENAVSVWIKPGSSLSDVLASANVRSTSTRSMGEGLYFVFLPDGENAEAAVARLKADSGVYDAGFVYDQLKVEPLKSSK
jgi:hypothetical protein